eukprot:TRINITY_DN600_c3_g1_i3.p2 TRINITY_DN600_c3_g1~~TRINITY_DN600_c3_g1_i3.p2  ORF type:complete len:104 (-),score=1.00 TRINITY_DN600_c3_g1_i3:1425-1736(-)
MLKLSVSARDSSRTRVGRTPIPLSYSSRTPATASRRAQGDKAMSDTSGTPVGSWRAHCAVVVSQMLTPPDRRATAQSRRDPWLPEGGSTPSTQPGTRGHAANF